MTPQTEGELLRARILDAIELFIEEHGYSPSGAEVAELVGRSKRTVNRQLVRLEEEGRITRGEGTRTLVITGKGR